MKDRPSISGSWFSQNHEERPLGCSIDTIILHSMYNPESSDPFSLEACRDCLEAIGLSVHYLIGRDGEVRQLVPEERRAWHAGESKMPLDGREGVNAFSIGIELIGSQELSYTDDQYQSLSTLCAAICDRHPISSILGHVHIAPERKSDPWNFDWERLKNELRELLPGRQLCWPPSPSAR